jgi:hypothetical protein
VGWHGLARSRIRYPLLANAVQRLAAATGKAWPQAQPAGFGKFTAYIDRGDRIIVLFPMIGERQPT